MRPVGKPIVSSWELFASLIMKKGYFGLLLLGMGILSIIFFEDGSVLYMVGGLCELGGIIILIVLGIKEIIKLFKKKTPDSTSVDKN
jgi:hypothetical protein